MGSDEIEKVAHFTRLGRGRCPYDPELRKIEKENKRNER